MSLTLRFLLTEVLLYLEWPLASPWSNRGQFAFSRPPHELEVMLLKICWFFWMELNLQQNTAAECVFPFLVMNELHGWLPPQSQTSIWVHKIQQFQGEEDLKFWKIKEVVAHKIKQMKHQQNPSCRNSEKSMCIIALLCTVKLLFHVYRSHYLKFPPKRETPTYPKVLWELNESHCQPFSNPSFLGRKIST